MHTRRLRLILAVCVALAFPGAASAGLIGVNEDGGRGAPDNGAALYQAIKDTGLQQVVISTRWKRGGGFSATEKTVLANTIAVAKAKGLKVVLAIYNNSGLETPGNAAAFAGGKDEFADYARQVVTAFSASVREVVVGNEPNRSNFMSPPDGKVFAGILAAAYDAIKAVDPGIKVIGAGISPRGTGLRGTEPGESAFPLQFIVDMGTGYRTLVAAGRTAPLMDAFSFHPYPAAGREADAPDKHVDWPAIGMADVDRLKQALWDAFNGTPQKTIEDGLLLDGDEDAYQEATAGLPGYTGAEPALTVDAATHGALYAQLVAMVACDPSIESFSFFHFRDEADRGRYQSGFEDIADNKRQPVIDAVKQAIAANSCPGTRVAWTHAPGVVGAQFDVPSAEPRRGDISFIQVRAAALEDAHATAWLVRLESPTLSAADKTALAAAADAGTVVNRGSCADGQGAGSQVRASAAAPGAVPTFRIVGCNRNGQRGDPLTVGRFAVVVRLTADLNPARKTFQVSDAFQVGVVCAAGQFDLDGLLSNGCEIDYATDPNNCGNIGRVVRPAPHATKTGCVNSNPAVLVCAPGFADDNKRFADGCEISFTPSKRNCVGINPTAGPAPYALRTGCKNGTPVVLACLPGYVDANGKFADGCELNLNRDPNNCGAVGKKVPPAAAAVTGCLNGAAVIVKCRSGRYDVDLVFANGCESTTPGRKKA